MQPSFTPAGIPCPLDWENTPCGAGNATGIPQKSEIQHLRETVSGTDSFLDKAKRYADITELTPELLRLFIEKIVVHEKEVKWSKHAPQTVEIYYNGIGYVGSGQQDVEETMEAPETQDPENPDRHRKHDDLSGYPRNHLLPL